jgi:CubicO group peptidase (beta-lactamase class C family)
MKLAMACAVAVAASVAAAAGPQTDEGRSWTAWLDGRANAFTGVALVARGDTILAVRAYGEGAGGRNGIETPFNIGSISKTFTAIAVAQLIQQNRLSLDDTLITHVPDYPNREAAARITIRDLVTHRSGVATFMRADFGAATVAEMTMTVGKEPQVFDPGAKQAYSNGGYIVLGRVIENVAGLRYQAYLTGRIFKPAGMAEPAQPGNPAGGAFVRAVDLFRFARALRTGRLLDRRMTEYVLNGTFAEAQKFGFSLREQMAGTRRFIGNGGGAPGVNAEFRFEPAGDYSVVVLSNSSPPAATELLSEILNRISQLQ